MGKGVNISFSTIGRSNFSSSRKGYDCQKRDGCEVNSVIQELNYHSNVILNKTSTCACKSCK